MVKRERADLIGYPLFLRFFWLFCTACERWPAALAGKIPFSRSAGSALQATFAGLPVWSVQP